MILQATKINFPKSLLLNYTLCFFENIIYTYITSRNGYVYVMSYSDKFERIPENDFYNSAKMIFLS